MLKLLTASDFVARCASFKFLAYTCQDEKSTKQNPLLQAFTLQGKVEML